VLVAAWATWVTFPLGGRDYESAIISGAFCGFAMGATATAIANMQALTRRQGRRPKPLSSCRSSARSLST
jgi:ESS family glutamate:Na+ symporter